MTQVFSTDATPAPLEATTLADFERDGFHIERRLYSSDEVASIRSAFTDFNRDGPVAGLSDIKSGFSPQDPLLVYPRVMQPHRHPQLEVGRLALEYLLDARLEPILRGLLRDEPIGAQTMFYFKPPGARGQALHQDNFYLRVAPGTCMAAWLAVDAADAENGGMMVVPGSHRTEIVCPQEADATQSFTRDFVAVPEGMRAVHVNLEPGDVLFFNGSLIHGSTPNSSVDRFRCSLIAHYVPEVCEEVA
jgi:phytanoyl-CoA hydroxylase